MDFLNKIDSAEKVITVEMDKKMNDPNLDNKIKDLKNNGKNEIWIQKYNDEINCMALKRFVNFYNSKNKEHKILFNEIKELNDDKTCTNGCVARLNWSKTPDAFSILQPKRS